MDTNAWLVLTGVLTALFTGIAIIQRVIERPRPNFSVFINSTDVVNNGEIACLVVAVNDGDGSALNCSIKAPNSSAYAVNSQDSSQSAYLMPGNRLSLSVAVDYENARVKETVDGVEWRYDGPIPDNGIRVKIIWHQAPYRHLAHSKTYNLSKLPRKQVFY